MSQLFKSLWLDKSKGKDVHAVVERNTDGRMLVIPDVHGCLQTLKALLDQVRLSTKDQLFFLGDYIDKGPDSLGVLALLMELVNTGYQVYPIRGNHEQDLLFYHEKWGMFRLFDPDFEEDDVEEEILEEYLMFMKSLPVYYIINDVLIVHAGLNFNADDPWSDYENMLEIRNFELPVGFKYRIIHGHSPTPIAEIEASVSNGGRVIKLDNACFFKKDDAYGRLLCLDVDQALLYQQGNVELNW